MKTAKKKQTKGTKKGYYILYKDQAIKIDPDVFSKLSKKFEDIYRTNPEKYVFDEHISDETFKAFISSCQLQPFSIQPLYALELLELARKWEVASLELYTKGICDSNGIVYRPRNDPLGLLIQHMDENCETSSDIEAVANILNDLFEDDRLSDLEPEILFRIVTIAEKKDLDQNKLKKFVIRLIRSCPESAVLLVLKINFDLLSEDDVDLIFHCPEMHEISINFFVAAALSSIRRKANMSINELDKKHKNTILSFVTRMEEERDRIENKMKDEHDAQLDEIMNILEEQHRVIEELTDILTEQAQKLENGPLSSSALSDENAIKMQDDTRLKMKKFVQVVEDVLQERKKEALGGIQKSVSAVEHKWVEDAADPEKVLKETEQEIEISLQTCEKQEEDIDALVKDLTEIKATLCAKIVKDKIRFDKGRRMTEDRFLIFDEDPETWMPSPSEVHSGESFLNGLDQRIDQECPIRGATKRE